jgi:hypothetical protein
LTLALIAVVVLPVVVSVVVAIALPAVVAACPHAVDETSLPAKMTAVSVIMTAATVTGLEVQMSAVIAR